MSDLYDREVEEALLAACVFKPELFHTASKIANADDFSDLVSAAIYKAVGELHAAGEKPDAITIRDTATSIISVSSHIMEPEELIANKIDILKSRRFTEENIEKYAQKVRRLSSLRTIENTFQSSLSEVTADARPEELASQAMESLLKLSVSSDTKSVLHYSELRNQYIDSLKKESEHLAATGELPGLRFGFSAMDDYTNGLREEDLMILAGDPGSGKTSTAMAIQRKFAKLQQNKAIPVGSLFVSLEMGEESTGMRWSQMIGSMTTRELRSGVSTQRIYDLDKKWQQEESIPLWMLFAPKMRADQLKASIAYMVKKNNIGLVVIDHLRRINMNDRYQSDNSLDEARITYLKADICKSLGVSVIAIAHTSKARASRDDKKPRMSDLSGSQMIAAEVDYLAFVYRPYEDLSDAERSDPSCYWTEKDGYLVWRKNRNDKLGDSKFYFDGSTMSIEDVKPQIQQPTPRGHELW